MSTSGALASERPKEVEFVEPSQVHLVANQAKKISLWVTALQPLW